MATEILTFDSMITPYRAKLKAYAMGFTNDEENANDLLQDTLLKAFTYFAKFKPETNFRACCSPLCVIPLLTITVEMLVRKR